MKLINVLPKGIGFWLLRLPSEWRKKWTNICIASTLDQNTFTARLIRWKELRFCGNYGWEKSTCSLASTCCVKAWIFPKFLSLTYEMQIKKVFYVMKNH